MTSKMTRAMVVGGLFVALMGIVVMLVFGKTGEEDIHQAINLHVEKITRLDARLNNSVLLLRAGISQNIDPINDDLQGILIAIKAASKTTIRDCADRLLSVEVQVPVPVAVRVITPFVADFDE